MNKNTKKYAFYAVILVLFAVLIIRFYRLQITESSIYSKKSQQNSVKMITRMPVRGNIYDRNGRLIVGNRPAFSLYLIPNETTEHTINIISKISEIPPDKIKQKLRKAGKFQPVKVIRQVDMRTLTWLQENILDLPGVEWKTEPKRKYTRSSGLAHLLGTLGEADERDLNRFPDLDQGDVIGKKALELAYDNQLRGSKGIKFVKVDAQGRVVDELTGKKESLPYPGKELYLTIDLRLQAYADSLMEGKRGALIAIDTRTGQVLTFLSNPDYDLTYFTGIIPTNLWNQLLNDPYHPLYDRASQSGYPPGSTFKLVAAIAALNEHIITPAWSANCPGYFRLGRRTIHCWKSDGHGTLDLKQAIKNSCNVYFYQLGLKIGLDVWYKYSKLFHFGEKTGIELLNENAGLVPSEKYYERIYGKNGWTKGMLANLAIGQGELLVTPLQMAQFVSIVANRGLLRRPHLGLKLYDPVQNDWKYISTQESRITGIDSSVFETVIEGMREVVAGGTGWRSSVWGIPGAGKTGTAQNPHGKSHAWYIGFAPVNNPEIAISIIVENGGSGGGVAAPIAGAYLKRYFHYQGKYDYEAERQRMIIAAKMDSIRRAEEANQNSDDRSESGEN
jgi:penicillin-binding protein 2